MKRSLILILLGFSFVIGYLLSDAKNEVKNVELEADYKKAYDMDSGYNYINPAIIKKYESPLADNPELTWFAKEYDSLEISWQKTISRVQGQEVPDQMTADAIDHVYIPWAQRIIQLLEEDELSHTDDRIHALELRIDSLEALSKYFRSLQSMHHKEYIKYDSKFREYIKDHPEVIE